jgi:hypothetical protein
MISSLLQKALSNRYISIAALTISISASFSLAAHSYPIDKDPVTPVSIESCNLINNIKFASNSLCGNSNRSIDIGSNVTYSNLRINPKDVKFSTSRLSKIAFSSNRGNYKYTISSPIGLLPEQQKY